MNQITTIKSSIFLIISKFISIVLYRWLFPSGCWYTCIQCESQNIMGLTSDFFFQIFGGQS